jgi:transposase-like protein
MSATVKALAKAVVAAMETPAQIVKTAQVLAQEPDLPALVGTAADGAPARAKDQEKKEFFGADMPAESSVSAVLKQLGAAVSSEITAADLAEALAVAAEESEITKEGVQRLAELLMGQAAVPGEGLDVDATPSKNEELKSALMAAVDSDDKLPSKEDIKSAISAMAMSSEETGTTPDEVVDVVTSMTKDQLIKAITKAKTTTATDARLRSRARREFWGVKTASTKDIATNVVGWLADYSTNFNIGTRSIVAAAKKFVADPDMAERLLIKAIEAKKHSEAGMKVTQDKSETMRFMCTVDDLDGVNPSDENFDESFKQKAIQVLSEKGYNVDPGTFSFTDLCVFEDGRVEASVSTRSTKTFDVDGSSSSPLNDVNGVDVAVVESPVVMTEGARLSRIRLRNEVLAKYAQVAPGMGMGGGMGASMGGAPGAAPMGAPGDTPPAPAGGDLGVSALTGGTPGDAGADMDAISEPGEKKPWGSVCPICGSDDVNIAESNADCQSCGSTYKILQSIELISEGNKGAGSAAPAEEEALGGAGLGEEGLGAATAPAPAPGMGGGNMAPMASAKSMFRLATTIDADVYLKTASADFDRTTAQKLPIGMVCPKCGDRNAHKVKSSTFCYECGTYSKTEVRANKKNPSLLDASITWID